METQKNTITAGIAAKQPTRQYQKPHTQRYAIPALARFKCKVWFLDGNRKCFYSYDTKETKGGAVIRDEWEGLMKLLRMIEKWHKDGTIKTAMIWANLDDVPNTSGGKYDHEIHKTTRWNAHTEDLNFLPGRPHVLLDTTRIKYRLAKQWELEQRQMAAIA